MPLDQPNTLASFFFKGLMLFEFNDQNQCEVSILQCADHDLTLDIFEIPTNPAARGTSINIAHSLSLEDDITVRLELAGQNLVDKDARPHHVPPIDAFNRAADTGDAQDFRWVLNLKDEVFPHEPLPRKNTVGPTQFKPKLVFNNGLFYTERKEDTRFTVVKLNVPVGDLTNTMLGRIAFIIGVDLTCPPGQGNKIVLENKNGPHQDLLWKQDSRYEIKVNNTCTLPSGRIGTDMQLYGDVLETSAPFDLRRVLENNNNSTGRRLAVRTDFEVDSGQQCCNGSTKPPGTG
jgi:hypothetical protein